MPTSRREREKEKARRTNAQEWANQQQRGGYEPTSVKLPKGFELYKLEPGKHLVDFMPYRVGKGNPMADEGFLHFERKFFIHRIPGPDGRARPFCCSYRCFGKKCAACQWLQTHGQTADKDLVRQLRISDRHLWVVNDRPGKSKNPLKVFDTNHYNRGSGFGEMMADIITSVPKYISFANLDDGWTVQLTVKEIPAGDFKYNGVTRIDFVPRDYEYDESMIDKAPCLDDLLIETDYDEMQKMLDMGESPPSRNGKPDDDEDEAPKARRKVVDEEEDEDDEDEDEAPKARKKVVKDDDDDDDDDEPKSKKKEPKAEDFDLEKGMFVTYKGVEYEISGISKDGTSLYLTDEDGNKPKGTIGPEMVKKVKTKTAKDEDDEEEDDDDDDEEQKPARKKGKAKAKADDEDEEEDDESPLEKDEDEDDEDEEEDDEDDEDEPKARKRKVKG